MANDSPQRGRSVAGIAMNEDRLFIARRKEGGSLGGKWEFPGGKVDGDESDKYALKREYLEEFGIGVNVGPLLASTEFSNKGKQFSLNAYLVFPDSLDFKMIEHTEWRWATMDEIESNKIGADGEFADSDLKLLPMLRECLFTA